MVLPFFWRLGVAADRVSIGTQNNHMHSRSCFGGCSWFDAKSHGFVRKSKLERKVTVQIKILRSILLLNNSRGRAQTL